jgi:hypothetical protein
VLSTELNILENIKEIKKNFQKNDNKEELKKKFYKLVSDIKVNAIKSEEVLDLVVEVRKLMVDDWRSKQHSVFSGVLLWLLLIISGSFIIYFRDFPFLPQNSIWAVILGSFLLFLGWFFINLGVHNLGHFIAGNFVGIHYNSWVTFNFFGQWALIIDYKSYLKASFTKRQIVHVSGPFCTLTTPWIIYFLIWEPVMLGIAIYMILASIPLMIKKGWDYGRIFRERKLKIQYKNNKD